MMINVAPSTLHIDGWTFQSTQLVPASQRHFIMHSTVFCNLAPPPAGPSQDLRRDHRETAFESDVGVGQRLSESRNGITSFKQFQHFFKFPLLCGPLQALPPPGCESYRVQITALFMQLLQLTTETRLRRDRRTTSVRLPFDALKSRGGRIAVSSQS